MPTFAPADVAVPAFTACDVRVCTDVYARVVFVVPDAVAVALRRAGRAGWSAAADLAYGEGHRYLPGTRVHAAAQVLLDLARGLPADAAISPAARAETERDTEIGALYALIVGRSGWDDAARTWANYAGTFGLHTPGTLHTDPYDGAGAIYWSA